MGWAARSGAWRWVWLYRQPFWRRLILALHWFRPATRRLIFRGGFRSWLWRGGRPPQWRAVQADRALILAAKREAAQAARAARRARRLVARAE